MSERGESARDAQQRVGDARRALTASTRALLEAVLAADHVNDADLTTATTMIDALTAGLREGSPPPEALPRPEFPTLLHSRLPSEPSSRVPSARSSTP